MSMASRYLAPTGGGSLHDMYNALTLDHNYKPDNIIVKYGTEEYGGVSFNQYYPEYADYNGFEINHINDKHIDNIDELSDITENDFVFLYLMGHGSGGAVHGIDAGKINDAYDMFDYSHSLIVLQGCQCGLAIDDIESDKRTILTAVTEDEYSLESDNYDIYGNVIDEGTEYWWDENAENEYLISRHWEFSHNLIKSMYPTKYPTESLSTDVDGNGYSSVDEMYSYAYNHDSARTLGWRYIDSMNIIQEDVTKVWTWQFPNYQGNLPPKYYDSTDGNVHDMTYDDEDPGSDTWLDSVGNSYTWVPIYETPDHGENTGELIYL